jgi:hypothetical protein
MTSRRCVDVLMCDGSQFHLKMCARGCESSSTDACDTHMAQGPGHKAQGTGHKSRGTRHKAEGRGRGQATENLKCCLWHHLEIEIEIEIRGE